MVDNVSYCTRTSAWLQALGDAMYHIHDSGKKKADLPCLHYSHYEISCAASHCVQMVLSLPGANKRKFIAHPNLLCENE